ncbi:ABC transporter permease [Streptomyces oceani]|uniref:ABC transporter substrate-binding protein n=1 Tax=Streptomyces oceani TaxID=1075402 RepID=A0A1E7KFF9_9ACTN|nr:ABC transporter permease [Streptomyces oceani]OEV02669.1 ABC transporter substrate-binding protein [Streptomyces oceani]
MFVAWRDLRFAKGRFALMGIVIVLITALVGLLSGLTEGLGRQNISAITGLSADRLAFAEPAEGQQLSFDDSSVRASQWRDWADVAGVRGAEPLGIAMTRAQVGERTTGVAAFGVREGSRLTPDATPRPGEVVLSVAAAEELDATSGDRVRLAGERYAVAEVAGDAAYSHAPVVWTGLGDWQGLAPHVGGGESGPRATVIALRTTGESELSDTDSALGTQTVSIEESLSAIGSYTSENSSLRMMRGFLFAISALVIGAFFTVWTIQRGRDVAVLKALGASTRYLLRDALGQAVLLLTLGTLAGTGVAAGVGAVISGGVPFVLDPATLLMPAGVMIALGAVGATLAIRRITAVDPLTALGSV